MTRRRTTTGAATTGLALAATVLAGCGDDSASDAPAGTAAPPATPPASASTSSAPSAPATPATPSEGTGAGADLATARFTVGWQDAVAAARADFDGKLAEVGMDSERPTAGYQVELVSPTEKYTVFVDAETGSLSGAHTEKIDSDESAKEQNETVDLPPAISWEEALKTAQAEEAGPVAEWKLEGDDRGPRYQFDLGTGSEDFEVGVDAETGEVQPGD